VVGHPEPEDGRIINCIGGENAPWGLSAPVRFPPFLIPLNSHSISVLARGQQAFGRVQVELDQTNARNEIIVDVIATYHDWDILTGTTVCLMEREKGELGVGVFVSDAPFTTVAMCSPRKRHQIAGLGQTEEQSSKSQ
jgi:hypothetical protein